MKNILNLNQVYSRQKNYALRGWKCSSFQIYCEIRFIRNKNTKKNCSHFLKKYIYKAVFLKLEMPRLYWKITLLDQQLILKISRLILNGPTNSEHYRHRQKTKSTSAKHLPEYKCILQKFSFFCFIFAF